MSHELKEGLELSHVAWPASPQDRKRFTIGDGDVARLTVVMQAGAASMVPWVKVTGMNGETLAMGNLLNCEILELRNGE